MDGARERRGGRNKRAEEGGSNGSREKSKGGREIGQLQGRYPEEDTGQYTVYSAQNNTQHGPCHCDVDLLINLSEPFSTRPSDRAQIWHACADRDEIGSHQKKLTHPTPGGFRGLSIVWQ